MKVSTILATVLAAAQATYAVDVEKSVIVSYDRNTPDHVVNKAMEAVRAAGGIITHEYKFIKAFAAKAPEKVLETVQTWGAEYNALVEEDEIVTVNTGSS